MPLFIVRHQHAAESCPACVADARRGELLLAYAMNGEPLPIQHGYPLRLVVPDWYAVASVKWLTEIELIDRSFVGHYQTDKYWYEWNRLGYGNNAIQHVSIRVI
jgi:DMSO/TMAO reductase YedYZ molybdopterin-dependent catalytic subunit